MEQQIKSPIFLANEEQKAYALDAIGSGIQQMQWQAQYVAKQVDALPALPEDATYEMKQGLAKKRVQVDAIEQKVETQIEFYNFCKDN